MRLRSLQTLFGLCLVAALLITPLGLRAQAAEPDAMDVSIQTTVVPEAQDFSTRAFGDAWDMQEFTDISQYLQGAGRHPSLANIQVKDGVFSAQTIGDYTANLGFFFPLFPGYQGFMQIGGNLGSRHQIESNAYDCFYIAMKVNSPAYKSGDPFPDGFRVLWYADQSMTPQGKAPNGGTNSQWLYSETVWPNSEPTVHNFKLYKVDLNNPEHGNISGGVKWNGRGSWPGLQINPSHFKNVPFQIDWMRLTSCATESEHTTNITWSPSAKITTLWARPANTSRNIQVATGLNGSSGSYSLDTQGFEAGVYKIGVGNSSGSEITWSGNDLRVNRTPVMKFTRPSAYSGEDYASSYGSPWVMNPGDIAQFDCTNPSFKDGWLLLDTLNPAALPGNCKGPSLGEADPWMYLKMPGPLTVGGQYRYLSFKMRINGAYALPADGMIGRWIWQTTNGCTRVSEDIPYEVGEQLYTIDLYDPANGTPVEASPGGCSTKPWKEAGEITRLRFDPNENWTGNAVPAMTFHQEFDWLRLTKVDRVARGSIYSVQLKLNRARSELKSLTYSYTTNPDNFAQDSIQAEEAVDQAAMDIQAIDAGRKLYLPLTRKDGMTLVQADVTYNWNTSNVPAGTYYICATANDGYSSSTFCSDAPVEVYNP